jgi:RNA polymerase sigma-70 factor (ECF subfamily)
MFDNNSYDLRTEIVKGVTKYFVSFRDGQDIKQDTEVSYLVYLEFLNFVKIERNLKRWTERRLDFTEITDESLYKQVLHPPKSVEETVHDNLLYEQLYEALENLPETQRRRFVLYYEFGFNYREIAELEGCTKQSVQITVSRAKKKIIGSLK